MCAHVLPVRIVQYDVSIVATLRDLIPDVMIDRFKYFMAIGVFANDALALERPFCVDTCLLSNIPSPPGQIPKRCESALSVLPPRLPPVPLSCPQAHMPLTHICTSKRALHLQANLRRLACRVSNMRTLQELQPPSCFNTPGQYDLVSRYTAEIRHSSKMQATVLPVRVVGS